MWALRRTAVIQKVHGDHHKGELRKRVGAPMMTAVLMAGAR
jgi:hypothetical protein